MLLDELKKANIEAMKAKDKDARSVISVVLTKCQLQIVECNANGKEFGDPQVLEVIQKVLKELSDEKEGYQKSATKTALILSPTKKKLLKLIFLIN